MIILRQTRPATPHEINNTTRTELKGHDPTPAASVLAKRFRTGKRTTFKGHNAIDTWYKRRDPRSLLSG